MRPFLIVGVLLYNLKLFTFWDGAMWFLVISKFLVNVEGTVQEVRYEALLYLTSWMYFSLGTSDVLY